MLKSDLKVMFQCYLLQNKHIECQGSWRVVAQNEYADGFAVATCFGQPGNYKPWPTFVGAIWGRK